MDKRYGGVSKTRQFTAGKLLNYFTLPKTNRGFENGWLEDYLSFHLGFRPIFQGPKPCWMLVFGLRLKPGWRYPQSCQEATKWAKNTGRSKWMKKKIWRDSMQRFQGGGGVFCVFFLVVFFSPRCVVFFFLDLSPSPRGIFGGDFWCWKKRCIVDG